jgi:competence protein ComGE
MLWKNDGFFLLELLLSLSALFMLSMFFVPLLIDFANQSQQLMRDKRAKQFLFEELQANLIEDRINTHYSVTLNGTEYTIYWRLNAVNGQKEVCVKVDENPLLPSFEDCAIPE